MFPLIAALGIVGLLVVFTFQDKKGQTKTLPPNTFTLTPEQVEYLRKMGVPTPASAGGSGGTIVPSAEPYPPLYGVMTPERQVLLETALSNNKNPAELEALALIFEKNGLPVAAASLRQRASFLRAQGDAVVNPPPPPDQPVPLGTFSTSSSLSNLIRRAS